MIFFKSFLYFMALSCLLLFGQCNSLDKEEPIPSYIHISSIDVTTKIDGSQGSNAQDIVDAWVYADKKLIGVFELPVTLPILKTGQTELTIFAGIKKNGRNSDRITYPFFTPYVINLNLVAEQIDTLKPVVTYKDGAVFSWIEDFEDRSVSMQKIGNATTIDTLFITSDPLQVFNYDGLNNRYSGLIKFNGIGTFEHANINSFDIPKQTDVFLELNYKSDVNVQFGFYAEGTFTSKVPVVLAYASNKWKKLYIGFTEDWNVTDYNGTRLKVYAESANGDATSNPIILLDNLKLVHF